MNLGIESGFYEFGTLNIMDIKLKYKAWIGEKHADIAHKLMENDIETFALEFAEYLLKNCSIPNVSTSGITLTWDKEIEYKSTGDFIYAIGNLMLAEIRMNREVHKDTVDCWVVGCCKIGDMANSRHLEFVYGGLEDEEWVKSHGEIFVKLPL